MKWQGIECSDALQLCDCPSTGLSVRALCDLREGDVVARIPKLACLTIKTSAARDLVEAAGLDGYLGLSVALMFERSLGENSAWAPYLHHLPYQECLPSVWTSEEIDSLLSGTEIHKVHSFYLHLFVWIQIVFHGFLYWVYDGLANTELCVCVYAYTMSIVLFADQKDDLL